MGRPKSTHVRLVAHITPELFRAIRLEAVERRLTIGELVDEAFRARLMRFTKDDGRKDRMP